jgi:hypothetical protein
LAQGVHDDAPTDDDDPIGQTAHVDDPVVLEYVPAAQGVHDDAPADDDDPIGQTEHVDDPALLEYVPAAHDVHATEGFEE